MGMPVVANKRGEVWYRGKKYKSGDSAVKAGAEKKWVSAAKKAAGARPGSKARKGRK